MFYVYSGFAHLLLSFILLNSQISKDTTQSKRCVPARALIFPRSLLQVQISVTCVALCIDKQWRSLSSSRAYWSNHPSRPRGDGELHGEFKRKEAGRWHQHPGTAVIHPGWVHIPWSWREGCEGSKQRWSPVDSSREVRKQVLISGPELKKKKTSSAAPETPQIHFRADMISFQIIFYSHIHPFGSSQSFPTSFRPLLRTTFGS